MGEANLEKNKATIFILFCGTCSYLLENPGKSVQRLANGFINHFRKNEEHLQRQYPLLGFIDSF